MKARHRYLAFVAVIVGWLLVFGVNGYNHVTRLTGQCCGYEGEPGFLLLFFLFWPGSLYVVALPFALIVTGTLISFWERLKRH